MQPHRLPNRRVGLTAERPTYRGYLMAQIRSHLLAGPVRRLAITASLAIAGAAMLLSPVHAADPTAAGLWQKVEKGKPVVWVLVLDHGGIFEGAIAKTFPNPD